LPDKTLVDYRENLPLEFRYCLRSEQPKRALDRLELQAERECRGLGLLPNKKSPAAPKLPHTPYFQDVRQQWLKQLLTLPLRPCLRSMDKLEKKPVHLGFEVRSGLSPDLLLHPAVNLIM
jgi:hypothetical protein